MSDWFNTAVVDLINDALTASRASEQFTDLSACDQIHHFVYVLSEVYDRAVEVGLIPAEPFEE